MAKKMKPGHKRCPECGALVKGPRTKVCPKCSHEFAAKQAQPSAPEQTVAVAEKTSDAEGAVTLEQIKAVAQAVKAVGGFGRFQELLATIKDVGGLRRFRELLDAISTTETGK